MKEILKQIIINFHQAQLPIPSLRELDFPELPTTVRKAYVLIGMRRSGKTWSLYQRMHNLINKGIKKEQLLYINFADDRLINIKPQDFQLILDAYFELYPEYINNNNLHLFLDEIHEVTGWEKFVRRLLDTENFTIYISGSSAKMLSKEIATHMRGRTIVREIFPFSFREYLQYKKVNFNEKLTSKQKSVIVHHANHFLNYGGFPETLNVTKAFHRELLQGYIDSVIYRDIIERYHITNVHIVKQLLIHCLKNSASILSVNKMYNSFKSQGYSLKKDSLYEFMGYFEDAYCIFSIPYYSFSTKKSTLKPKKIYSVDQGLITAYTVKTNHEKASRLETTVFSYLRRKNKELYYYQTQSGKEIDFMTLDLEGNFNLYQVTNSLSNDTTKKREITALQEAMEELNINIGTIVTLDEKKTIKTSHRIINCIPLWEFLIYD